MKAAVPKYSGPRLATWTNFGFSLASCWTVVGLGFSVSVNFNQTQQKNKTMCKLLYLILGENFYETIGVEMLCYPNIILNIGYIKGF